MSYVTKSEIQYSDKKLLYTKQWVFYGSRNNVILNEKMQMLVVER